MILKKQVVCSFLFLIGCFFLTTGCGNEKLDMKIIKDDVTNIESDKTSMGAISMALSDGEEAIFKELDYIYQYNLEELFKINQELVIDAIGAINKDTKEMYLIIEPDDGKIDDIKKTMITYFESNKITNNKLIEKDAYLIYLVTDEMDKATKIVNDTKQPLFSMIMSLTDDNLESMIGINPSDLKDYVIYLPMSITNTNLYMVIEPEKGKKDKVQEAVNEYLTRLEKNFETYLPDQYEIIKNRKETTYGDYLIYIASTDNEKVLKEIKNCK